MNTIRVGKGKFFLFAFTAMALSCCVMLAVLIGMDLYLHKRYAQAVGLNVRGYRGPVAKRKQPGEQRLVVHGGSTAFGYGVRWDETFAAFLERKLNERRRQSGNGPVRIMNLAYNNEGAYAAMPTLRDYEYLNYDGVILYEGYNDLGGSPNTLVYRHTSPVFKLTGYLPIFPLILKEKAMALRYGGNLEAAYWGRKTVFRPNVAAQTTASALEAALRINASLERQLERFSKEQAVATPSTLIIGCHERWAFFCQGMAEAIDYVVSRGKSVVVVTQPYLNESYVNQQQAMGEMLHVRYGKTPGVHYINLGKGVIDLNDPALCYDSMHLTVAGNERIADHLVEPLWEALGHAQGALYVAHDVENRKRAQ